MISNFSIISSRGDTLLEEKYRNDIAEDQVKSLISTTVKSKNDHKPFLCSENAHVYSIIRDEVFYFIASKTKITPIVIIKFLENFYVLLRNFCGGSTEHHISKNLLLVYELMTECIDNGFLKMTSTEQVRHTIYSEPNVTKYSQKLEVKKPGPFGMEKVFIPNKVAEKPLVKSRSQQGVQNYEVFVDVFEEVSASFSKDGLIQMFNLHGSIHIKSFLSTTHLLIINLVDHLKEEILKGLPFDTLSFHECVDSTKFKKNQSFVLRPTQGEIIAMTYTMKNPICIPFRLISNIEESGNNRDCDLTLKLTCNLPSEVQVMNVVVNIPVSSSTRNIMQQFSMLENSAEHVKADRKIVWKLKKMSGQGEVVAKFKLIDAMQVAANRMEMGPISLNFEASHSTCSGVAIRNVRAEDPSGKVIPIHKWVRYVTVPHSYIFRI